MAQNIKQGNIFGRIGQNLGQGLAEQIPKEVERNRFVSGLQDLEKNGANLNPQQYFTKALQTYGLPDRPQVVQSLAELARQQGIRNSFGRLGKGQENQENASPQAREIIRQGNMPQGQNPGNIQRSVVQGGEKVPTDFQNRTEEATAGQGIVKENPTQNKFLPVPPWTPAERDADIGREAERHPELTFDQIQQRVADNERRYLAAPEAYREQQKYLQGLEDAADAEFDKQLSTALQKEGKAIYGDLTGETLLDVKKAMRNDIATNPNLKEKQAAEKWVKKGKDFVEKKNQVKATANRSIVDRILPNKKESTLKSLIEAQKSYNEMGRKREYYNTLQSANNPETGSYGFSLSPGGAALIAYPRSQPLKNTIKSFNKFDFADPRKSDGSSRKAASEFGKNRTNGDSVLSFARNMQYEYPSFNTHAFIDYLRDNRDELNLNPDQIKEIELPYEDFFPNWGDLALFPYIWKGSVYE